MGSIIDYEKCPRCGGVLSTEFNYRTYEEWKSCNRCGHRDSWHYVRDKNGNIVLDDKCQPQKEFDNLIGFGAAYLQFEKVGVCYPFSKPSDKELKEAFYAELQSNDKLVKEKCYLSVWDDEVGDVRAEYGSIPETFNEFEAHTENNGKENDLCSNKEA